jgi:hypothetical protein
MAFDLTVLGVGVAALDAHDEGELLRTDMLRSLLPAVVFGGQVALTLLLTGTRPALIARPSPICAMPRTCRRAKTPPPDWTR